MRTHCDVYFEPTRSHPKRAIEHLVSDFDGLKLCSYTDTVMTSDDKLAKALYKRAKCEGFKCSLEIHTIYDASDAVSGEFGILGLGPAGTTAFRGVFPPDAFDFSTACPACGLGAAPVKPHLLSERSLRCSANFYYGQEGTSWPLMRAEIGRSIIEATGQPWCMRHPVTRSGRIIKEWMEPVPCATMPPLSSKSRGVMYGKSLSCSSVGEGPEDIAPCRVCHRAAWCRSFDRPLRLVYPREAVEAARDHAVVMMYEPFESMPEFDPVKRQYTSYYGMPWLLFNKKAIEVLLDYIVFMDDDHVRDTAAIQPVFSE